MKTFRITLLLALLLAVGQARAQRLIPMNRFGSNWDKTTVSSINKPNGNIYRLREDVKCNDLPQVAETEGLNLIIAEPIDIGWLGLYRRPMGSVDYRFIVVLCNHEKQPMQTLDLCEITGNDYCEVQDVRWDSDNHRLLFNMACPSYASDINGKGSKLYSYDPEARRIVWETDYLVSNDIFITNSKYVFCSYGFTSEKKFLYMLDKQTGQMYSKLPMVYKVEYMELQQKGGRELLYVVDYNEHLFTFAVSDTKAKPAAAKSQTSAGKSPEVFTVVYATSDDGFLNVRQQPTTKSAVVTKLYEIFYCLGGGVLLEKGDTWSKVSVGGKTGWVYNKYLGYQTWYKGHGPKLIANRDNMPIYGENYADEGSLPVFVRVKKGTVIADDFVEHNGYYELRTGHDFLFIKVEDAVVK